LQTADRQFNRHGMPTVSDPTPARAPAAAVRWFGRFQLLRLLGKSEQLMAWLVADARSGQELMLVLPRRPSPGAAALEQWQHAVRKAARLDHPNLAPAVEIGVHESWPFVTYDPHDGATLRDRLPTQGLPAADAAQLLAQALQGLAYAHEAGAAHRDPQLFLMIVSDSGTLRWAGLEVGAADADAAGVGVGVSADRAAHAPEPGGMRARQDAAQRDVLAVGIAAHEMLTGKPALDDADTGRVASRLPPLGRDIVRLAWDTAQPVPDPLRAIVNRATDRQERQRYRNARTLQHALESWLQVDAANGGGPLALLHDRIRAAGVLPSSPGAAQRAARLALMDRQRTHELAEVVLQDVALAFELLRAVNVAQVRGAQVSGSGPVLTVRRAIAMLGLDGVRRSALTLRPWPGPLAEPAAAELERLIERVKHAGLIAVALRPAGYDSEVVYLITLLQNLGRLVVQYHLADEAQQIRRLMQPAPPTVAGEREEPGMSEEGAAFAVLGVDIEAIGAAVARHWGLDDTVLHMVRRLPAGTPVRSAENDGDLLRAAASCGNETVDALGLPPPQMLPALQRVVQRYGRSLGLTMRELQAALTPGQAPVSAPTAMMDLDPLTPAEHAEPGARM
jgi:eukaryotic-like serine/threonine-protein kinase